MGEGRNMKENKQREGGKGSDGRNVGRKEGRREYI
jgi:hypothetical protein